mgnify:CR=1 FL=1
MKPMILFHNFFGHLSTINHHKYQVMKNCFRVGLYKQGLLHDMSKYSPTEFLVGCKYYQGNRSPNNAEREATGYSRAWLHHKGRNKHHYEYWIDYGVARANTTYGVIGVKVWIYKGEVLKGEIPAQRTTEKPRRRNNDNRSRRPRVEKKEGGND